MRAASSLTGVWTAALSPFDELGVLDTGRLAAHCRALLAQGCRGVSLFGTTGEGTAFSAGERMAGLEAVVAAGIPGERIMPATGCCDVPTTVALTRHAAELGAPAALLLPPFYMKGVGEDGLFRHFAEIVEKLAGAGPALYLYNFPELAGLTLAPRLVRRLADAFPDAIVGLKDSSADWPLSSTFLDMLPDLDVFLGDERSLAAARRKQGAGTISGMANFIAPELARVCADPGDADAQARIDAAVKMMVAEPFIATAKAVVAELGGDPAWRRVRAPLEVAEAASGRRLVAALGRLGVLRPAG